MSLRTSPGRFHFVMPSHQRIPLFPLGLVLYPNERLPLHIFEPRYKEMTQLCLDSDSPFGIVFFDDGKMSEVGCTARINTILERYEDGRMDLVVDGETRFQVVHVFEDQAYLTAEIAFIEEAEEGPLPGLQQRVIT